jgi:hypothetical protein
MEQGSEVARVMQQIELELEAAQRGMNGFAITARHDFINARMQRGGEHILRLIDAGRHEEAQALMNTENWGIADEQKMIKRRSRRKRGYKKVKGRGAGDETSGRA